MVLSKTNGRESIGFLLEEGFSAHYLKKPIIISSASPLCPLS